MLEPSREPLHEVLTRAFEESGVWERVMARLPGFAVPYGFRFRRMGERILATWGVEACAQILIAARWRQAALLLVLLATGLVASGTLPRQLVGVALDVFALAGALNAGRRRKASGIPMARRSKVGHGQIPV